MRRSSQKWSDRLARTARWATVTIVMILCSSQGTWAAVTKATLKAAQKVYSGDCPGKIVFNGTITVNRPGTVYGARPVHGDGAVEDDLAGAVARIDLLGGFQGCFGHRCPCALA